jgi:serine/threonine-protein kinase
MDAPLGSRYVLHELLGRGAMGQVYRGSVRGSGDPVAVKVLKPELVSDTEVVARFFQERSILTSIGHPNVARVLDLVVEGDTLGIVMELVQGQDLRRYLWARGTFPPGEAAGLVCQLLQGLAAVHAAGVVHRDVKPENVLVSMISRQVVLKLTDFGVARLSYGASLTKMTSLIGTPEYMAPELADHDTATPAADLYSAGIVLYEMLAGRTPFAGGHPLAVLRRQVEQPPPPVPGIPPALWAQIESLLAKDPRSRPGSATEALHRLAPLQNQLGAFPALPPMPDQFVPASGQTVPGREPVRTPPPREPVWTAPPPAAGQTVLRARDRGLPPTGETEPPPAASRRAGHGRTGAQRRRRALIISVPAALVIAAGASGWLLTHSAHAALAAPGSQATATGHASQSSQSRPPAPSKTASESASSRVPATQTTSQAASTASGSAPSAVPQFNPTATSAPVDPLPTTPVVFSRSFGTHGSSNFALDVLNEGGKAGQPIIMSRTPTPGAADEWVASIRGTTADVYNAGLVSPAVAQHYGCIPGRDFASCYGQTAVAVDDPALELEYAPHGVDSGLCMGLASTAVQGEGVTLQPCGTSSRTMWIEDNYGSSSGLSNGYVPLINGSDTDFSQPFVLSYPVNGFPTDLPRPQLEVSQITGSSPGSPAVPELGTVNSTQLWGAN